MTRQRNVLWSREGEEGRLQREDVKDYGRMVDSDNGVEDITYSLLR